MRVVVWGGMRAKWRALMAETVDLPHWRVQQRMRRCGRTLSRTADWTGSGEKSREAAAKEAGSGDPAAGRWGLPHLDSSHVGAEEARQEVEGAHAAKSPGAGVAGSWEPEFGFGRNPAGFGGGSRSGSM